MNSINHSIKKRLTPVALALVCSLALTACSRATSRSEGSATVDPPTTIQAAAQDVLRAVTVEAREYPSRQEMTTDELEAEADALLAFAQESSLNAVFYAVNPQGGALYPSKVLPRTGSFTFKKGFFGVEVDPLQILTQRAAQQGVAVYAVLDPYRALASGEKAQKGTLAREHPEALVSLGDTYYRPDNPLVHTQTVQAAAELAGRYTLTGIVVGGADGGPVSDYPGFYTYLNALVSDVSVAARAASPGIQVGLRLSAEADESDNRTAFITGVCQRDVDFINPLLTQSPEGGMTSPYARAVDTYLSLGKAGGVPVYTTQSFSNANTDTLSMALYVNNLKGLSGGVLEEYGQLSQDPGDVLETVIPLMHLPGPILPDMDLRIPTEFRLTRPLDGDNITLDSTWETYYITGTSDPKAPVFCDGKEVTRISSNGTFGILVELEEGENTFKFQQGAQTATATLTRTKPGQKASITKISTYVNKSNPSTAVFQPYGPQAVNDQLPLLLQCTAPAGGTVTAALAGQTYTLEQTATADEGTPVLFKKEVRIPAVDPDAVVSLGLVRYTLDFLGETSDAEAPGEVFLFGKNRPPLFRVEAGMGNVLNPSMQNGDFMTTLKTGSVGEIVGQTANYFKTSFGGWIQKKEIAIVTDLSSPKNTVDSVQFIPANEKGDESLVLHGTLSPSFAVDESGSGDFVIRLFDTYGIANGELRTDSVFFRSVIVENSPDGVATLTFKGGLTDSYYGYNVSYDGTDTILSFKAKPRLSSVKGRPLTGLTIVVDPGHGATDVGAMGLAGVTGPMEKNANMYASHITAQLLQALGATVEMTRYTDEDFLELDERVRFTEQFDTDLFMSIHHNSTVETINPEKVQGTWVYYYNDISADIAQVYLDNISAASGRRAQGTEDAYYVVCRNTLAPSVLLELGFMPNAREYEGICNPQEMLKIAGSICQSVVEYVGSLG